MTKPKSKPKAAVRSTSRSTSKSRTCIRLAPSSSKTAMRPDTKHARIIAMLRTPAGTTIAAIMTATHWQQHSVRGFLAGVVRKKLGLNLVSEQTDKGRVYRIKDGKACLPTRGVTRCWRSVAAFGSRLKLPLRTRSRICAVSISKVFVHDGRAYFRARRPITCHGICCSQSLPIGFQPISLATWIKRPGRFLIGRTQRTPA